MTGSDKQTLVVRTVLIAAVAPLVAFMLVRSYRPGGLLWELLRSVGTFISPSGAVPIEFVSTLLVGVYLGFLTLFTLDERKRVQGVLLCFGTVIGVAVMAWSNILLPNIDFLDPYNIGALVGGVLAGGSIEVPQLKTILYTNRSKSQVDLSFPRAGWGLFAFLSGVVVAGLIGSVVAGTSRILLDLPVTVFTVYLLFGFVRYTTQSDVAVIGPRESGKSLLLLGLYLSFRERDIAGSAEGYMQELLSQADSMTPGDDFPIANTYDLEELWFFVTKGGLFPERIKLTATDHTGELLTRLGEDLADSQSLRDRLKAWKTKYRIVNPLVTVTPGGKGNYRLFEQQVRTADVVVLCVDVERIQNGDVGFIESLQTIGTRAQSNGATVLVVATKCDLLIEEFSSVADNPLDQGLDREFSHEIEQRLREGYPTIDELCDAVGARSIYPVYYETTEAADGRLIPLVDGTGALQYQGMETVGDDLLVNL